MKNEKLALQKWIQEAEETELSLSQYMLRRAAAELDTTEIEVLNRMGELLRVMEASIEYGLTGVKSHSGLTGGAAKALQQELRDNRTVGLLGPVAQEAMVYALAVAEANAAMGRIVAAPTAGASGVLPGVLFALKGHYDLSEDTLRMGLVVAGCIGEVIADRASIAGATGGCQAECGSGAAMAAGATVAMLGGSNQQIGIAVAITLKNLLGLVCDPVAGLVEVPCIKRNASCAVQAIVAAEMALAGVGSFIPPDEAIDAMKEVGDSLPCSLKETACGGLARTPTAIAWSKAYFGRTLEEGAQ